MTNLDYMTAREAAALLGVGRATLYAYVSRGLIRSEPFGNGRQKRYLRSDIDSLVRRRQGQPDRPGPAGPQGDGAALPSAITLIADDRLYYRGHDAVALSAGLGLEETARLLWQTGGWDPFAESGAPPCGPVAGGAGLSPLLRLMASLPLAEAADPQAVNHSARGCARTGARLLAHARDVMVPPPAPAEGTAAGGTAAGPAAAMAEGRAAVATATMHDLLAARWEAPPGAADMIRRCLVLCADHEFNASAFAARCVAGTGASVYAGVTAALAALRGPRHGGATARVGAMLDEILPPATGRADIATPTGGKEGADPAAAVSERLARGEEMPGFGHPLYRDRDPRATALLQALARHAPSTPQRRALDRIVATTLRLSERHPNLDFALVAVCRVMRLPPDAPIVIFALGRMTGWVAHIEEQYRDGRLVRPRSIYTAPPPR